MDGVTHSYYYVDGKLVRETYDDTVLDFFYDANGIPFAMKQGDNIYYYITNLQGDVIQLVDAAGNIAAQYQYDPYGKVILAIGSHADINPIRYRGYYYDTETGLYYLLSRYYDPEIGRFINADAFASTGQGLLGNNMFAYCNNNPVNSSDPTGEIALGVVLGKAVLGASVNVLTTYIGAIVTGQSYSWKDAGVAALSGALGTGNTLLKVAAGVVSGAYSGYMAYQNGASKQGVIASGLVSALGTTVSVANIAGWTGTNLSPWISTMTDVVFGTSANTMGAIASRVSTDSALLKTNQNSQKTRNTSNTNRAKLVAEMALLY